MSLGIGSNPFALNPYNQLQLHSASLAQSIMRLSSGKRINSAADDPAGLAISMQMTGQINGLGQSVRNTQDAISLVQTADGTLSQTANILQRMQTLATQAANGTNTSSDLAGIQTEMNQLTSQLTQISNTTNFHTRSLLSGALQNMAFQIGPNAGSTLHLSIGAMDAASLGVASNTANLTSGQNNTLISSLVGVGAGLQDASSGETYQIKATQLTGGVSGTIYNTAGTASATATAATNGGNETAALTIGGGTYGGATANFQVQVTSVSNNGTITGVQYSTSATGTPSWTQATATSTGFTLGATGISVAFTNKAASPQVGDQFNFTATSGAATAVVQATVSTGKNIGNETGNVAGTYSGTTNLQYAVRASALDSNNNVVGVQVSSDGGQTFGTTITATGYAGVAFAAGTATAFSIGNGLTYNWATQSTFNANQVANNGDTMYFNAVAANQTTQLLQLSDSTLSSGVAKYSGTAANIGNSVLLNNSQTSATLGTGTQTVTANFTAPNVSGGIIAGTSAFTVATPQAAITGNGAIQTAATASAGPNVMTAANASAAIAQIQSAIDQVSQQQSALGATQNTLGYVMQNLMTESQNLTSANDAITGVDYASETVNLTTERIIQQSAIAMLAQANTLPEMLLKLLS